MGYSLLIKNGHVIDTEPGVNGIKDVAVSGRKSAGYTEGQVKADMVIDAAGCYVFPGLIDFHCHVFNRGSALGMDPNMLPSMGVTTAVDAGSCGSANFESFKSDVINHSAVRILEYLNVCAYGQPGDNHQEDLSADKYAGERIAELLEQYPEYIKGLKIRMGEEVLEGKGEEPLKRAKMLAEELHCSLVVHASRPPFPEAVIASYLKAHDVICHCFHKKNEFTILDKDGRIDAAILDARERGVIFDACVGITNYNHEIAMKAIAQGFLPDIISTDATRTTVNRDGYCKNLPYVMSKMMRCGMELEDVVRAVTQTPARELGLAGKIGTLREGAFADITVCRMIPAKPVFMDNFQNPVTGEKLLVPVMTIKNGEIAYRQTDF